MHLEEKLHRKQTSWVEPGCPFSEKHSDLHRSLGHRVWFASYGDRLLRKSWTQMCLWQAWKKCAPWLWPVSKHKKMTTFDETVGCTRLLYVEWTFQNTRPKPLDSLCCSSMEVREDTGMIIDRTWSTMHIAQSQNLSLSTSTSTSHS